jgi:hypothetical protein
VVRSFALHRLALMVACGTLAIAPVAAAQTDPCAPRVVASDGTFLGVLSNDKFDNDSIGNPYGPYGSQFSATSIKNRFGEYGSEFSAQSPRNRFAADPPRLVDPCSGQIHGLLTNNPFAVVPPTGLLPLQPLTPLLLPRFGGVGTLDHTIVDQIQSPRLMLPNEIRGQHLALEQMRLENQLRALRVDALKRQQDAAVAARIADSASIVEQDRERAQALRALRLQYERGAEAEPRRVDAPTPPPSVELLGLPDACGGRAAPWQAVRVGLSGTPLLVNPARSTVPVMRLVPGQIAIAQAVGDDPQWLRVAVRDTGGRERVGHVRCSDVTSVR